MLVILSPSFCVTVSDRGFFFFILKGQEKKKIFKKYDEFCISSNYWGPNAELSHKITINESFRIFRIEYFFISFLNLFIQNSRFGRLNGCVDSRHWILRYQKKKDLKITNEITSKSFKVWMRLCETHQLC